MLGWSPPAGADDDDLIGGEGHLGHEVAEDEDLPAFARQALEQVAYPADTVRV